MAEVGFGWNLYGFFIAAVIWLAVYFYWAWRAAARDRRQGADTAVPSPGSPADLRDHHGR